MNKKAASPGSAEEGGVKPSTDVNVHNEVVAQYKDLIVQQVRAQQLALASSRSSCVTEPKLTSYFQDKKMASLLQDNSRLSRDVATLRQQLEVLMKLRLLDVCRHSALGCGITTAGGCSGRCTA